MGCTSLKRLPEAPDGTKAFPALMKDAIRIRGWRGAHEEESVAEHKCECDPSHFHRCADLRWVTPAAACCSSPVARAVSRAASRAFQLDANNVDDIGEAEPGVGVRLQVQLSDGWCDVSAEEAQEICENLAMGNTIFQLHARGRAYAIDFTNANGATQTNEQTGKTRRLRVLDADDGEPHPVSNTEWDGPEAFAGSRSDESQVQLQRTYGPQSLRACASQGPRLKYLADNPHAQACFEQLAAREQQYCGAWAVFYHSYSFAALLYEVQAAVASVLFRFRSHSGALPRILVQDFHDVPDAHTLLSRFNAEFADNKRDHNPAFRRVGISAMCSLVCTGPEACVAKVFNAGYSCKDVSFRQVLCSLLETLYVPKAKVSDLAEQIIALSERHGLDVSQFGGRPCKTGKAGHLLQIFVRRDLVDRLCYAAHPYGPVDEERMPLSQWMNGNHSFAVGQARLLAHPKFFMRSSCVRLFVASAEPTFSRNRRAFQDELVDLIKELGEPVLRERAASGIYGGTLPAWWSSEDQRSHIGQ
mmetsp:Transcript_62617/g.201927  ORF Transcript_62617/g.201927 Transcript_62617/m.201927 type:complete len:530 (-) Transcript_62617:257-1846(-)